MMDLGTGWQRCMVLALLVGMMPMVHASDDDYVYVPPATDDVLDASSSLNFNSQTTSSGSSDSNACASGGGFSDLGIGVVQATGGSLDASEASDEENTADNLKADTDGGDASDSSAMTFCSLAVDNITPCYDVGISDGMSDYIDAKQDEATDTITTPQASLYNYVGITLDSSGNQVFCTLDSASTTGDNSAYDTCVCVCGEAYYRLSVSGTTVTLDSSNCPSVGDDDCPGVYSCDDEVSDSSEPTAMESDSGQGAWVQTMSDQYDGDDLTYTQLNLLAPPDTDLSIYYLGFLFGQVGGILASSGSNSLLGVMFNLFSLGILFIAGWMVAYGVVVSVFKNASDGDGGQQGGSTFWGPLRAGVGVVLLVPQFSGYSIVQTIVMWAVVQGVGAADAIWAKAVDYIDASGGGVYQTATPSDYAYIKTLVGYGSVSDTVSDLDVVYANQMLASSLCLQALMHQADITAASSFDTVSQSYQVTCSQYNLTSDCDASDMADAYRWQEGYDADAVITADSGDAAGSWIVTVETQVPDYEKPTYLLRFGDDCGVSTDASVNSVMCYGSQSNVGQCGLYEWTLPSDDVGNFSQLEVQTEVAQATEQLARSIDDLADSIYSSAVSALADDESLSVDDLTTNLSLECSTSGDCFASRQLQSFVSTYYTAIRPFMAEDAPDAADWTESAKSLGWLVAGTHYWDLIGSDGSSNNVTMLSPNHYLPALCGSCSARSALLDSDSPLLTDSSVSKLYQASLASIGNFGLGVFALINQQMGASMLSLDTVNDTDQYNEDIDDSAIPNTDTGGELTHTASTTLVSSMNTILQTAIYLTAQTVYRSDDFPTTGSMVVANIGLPQNNMQVLVAEIVGAILGLQIINPTTPQPYDDNAQDNIWAWGATDWTSLVNQSCKSSTDMVLACTPLVGNSSCYDYAVDGIENAQACMLLGQGMLGSVEAVMRNYHYDPVLNITKMGNKMVKTSLAYWQKNTVGVYSVSKGLSSDYAIWMGVVGAAGSVVNAILGMVNTSGKVSGDLSWAQTLTKFLTGVLTQLTQYCFSLDQMRLTILVPFGSAVSGIFFVLGNILSYYVPLVPFLIFLFSAIGWFIAVVESMVAMPLVALGITHPQGHDYLGRVEQAVILLLGVFVQPSVLILGFIGAIMLSYVAITLLNYGYILLMAHYLNNFVSGQGMMVLTEVICMMAMLIVYGYLAVQIITQAFSMVYQVPERIIRWVGGMPTQSGTAQAMSGIRSSAGATGRLGDGVGSVAGRSRLAASVGENVRGMQRSASGGLQGAQQSLGDEKQNKFANSDSTKGARAALGVMGVLSGGM